MMMLMIVEDNGSVQSDRYMRGYSSGIIFHSAILNIEVLFRLFLIFLGQKDKATIKVTLNEPVEFRL